MNDDQRDTLNRFLAERVMGWVEGELNGNQVYRSYEGCEMFVNAWNPCELLRYCEPLLDKIERDGWEWELRAVAPNWGDTHVKNPRWQYVACLTLLDKGYENKADTRTEALCLTIARAYGWKEEANDQLATELAQAKQAEQQIREHEFQRGYQEAEAKYKARVARLRETLDMLILAEDRTVDGLASWSSVWDDARQALKETGS